MKRGRRLNAFGYLSVLISVVVGLALAHLLTSAARLIQRRGQVRSYGPTLLWMATLFLIQVEIWWSAYASRETAQWTFFSFLYFLATPGLVYLACYVLVPDLEEARPDLRGSYYRNRVWFFGLLAAVVTLSVVRDTVAGMPIQDPNTVFRLVFFVFLLLAMRVRRQWFHEANAVFGFVLFCAYVAVLYVRLR